MLIDITYSSKHLWALCSPPYSRYTHLDRYWNKGLEIKAQNQLLDGDDLSINFFGPREMGTRWNKYSGYKMRLHDLDTTLAKCNCLWFCSLTETHIGLIFIAVHLEQVFNFDKPWSTWQGLGTSTDRLPGSGMNLKILANILSHNLKFPKPQRHNEPNLSMLSTKSTNPKLTNKQSCIATWMHGG